MGTILLLDEDDERARAIMTSLGSEAPGLVVKRVRTGMELRYAVATMLPLIAILGAVRGPQRARPMAWEIHALRPSTLLLALTYAESEAAEWRSLACRVVVAAQGLDAAREVVRAVRAMTVSSARHAAAGTREVHVDAHRLRNRLAGLLAGMHAFAAELRAMPHDAIKAKAATDEYVERLAGLVADISAIVAASELRAPPEHES